MDAAIMVGPLLLTVDSGAVTAYDATSQEPRSDHPGTLGEAFPGLWADAVDAALLWGSSGQVFFFAGSEYGSFDLTKNQSQEGYPRPIAEFWPGVWDRDLDAAICWRDKAYFFKGAEYVRYDMTTDQKDEGYPQRIADHWPGLWTENLDAAVMVGEDQALFFRDGQQLRYDLSTDSVVEGYPTQFPLASSPVTPDASELSEGRRDMLALIEKWFDTSLSTPHVPEGETADLLSQAGWSKATGDSAKAQKDAGGKVMTSCGDVVKALLRLWRSDFLGAFGIREAARPKGFYVDADGSNAPLPGDILVLESPNGQLAHVCVLVSTSESTWRTADGGGGLLPDQKATVSDRAVTYDDNNRPVLVSPTDGRPKHLDGWVDLDRLSRTS